MNARAMIGNFTAVDQAPDSSWFVAFMDRANALPEYRAIKDDLVTALGELEGRAVLEVGCGTGDDARELAARVGATGRVVATDLSETMVLEAHRRSAGSTSPVTFRTADLRALDFPDDSFDCARAKLVLMHCEDIDAALDELIRVVRPGGRIAAFDYDFDTTIVDHPDPATTRDVLRCFSDGHRNNWSGRALRRRMSTRNLGELAVLPRTVVMPFGFFSTLTAGLLTAATETGRLDLTADQLRDWWQPLARAEDLGTFFASFTGFTVGGTVP